MSTHKKLMTLFSKAGFDDQQRHELVYSFTGGRTQSTKSLTISERDALCEKLAKDFRFTSNINAYNEIEKRKKRSVVLAIASRTGIHDPSDWSKFNQFMLNSSRLKQSLNKYNVIELDALIKQFRALERNYNKSAEKFGTKAYLHKNKMPQISYN